MITKEAVNQAIDYIMKNIGKELSIEEIADYCHFSKFYFSRVFKEETGESIYAFIKRVKMEQSAFRLKVERGRSITDVGYEYGYSPSNYSTVFKQHHGVTPVNFRRNIYEKSVDHLFHDQKESRFESYEECNRKVSIKNLEDCYVIYERQIGNYHNLSQDWNQFTEKYREYITEKTLFFERTYDDPTITDADSCLYDICMSVGKECPLENTYLLQGGKFAIYHYEGLVDKICKAYQTMFNVWFPQNHYEIDERYGFDIYHSIDCETKYAIMDICIPIR